MGLYRSMLLGSRLSLHSFAFASNRVAIVQPTTRARVHSMAGDDGSGTYTYMYPRPAVTVDAALVTYDPVHPHILLIKRKNDPYAGKWALPGGFVDENEPLWSAAYRELEEETSIPKSALRMPLRQVETFGDPGRDPRGWTVTVVYGAVVDPSVRELSKAADDAAEAEWFDCSGGTLPDMAFDHDLVVHRVLEAVRDWKDTPDDLSRALDRCMPHFTGGVKNPE